ncbi:MAG: DEAD/DEAH box helicase, partial [Myxococcales bacterium]|nr:DEAD/DEAH box helicase [Myxococcales bacterium]
MDVALPTDRPLVNAPEVAARLLARGRLRVVGASGSATALVVRALTAATPRPLVVVTRDLDHARALAADLAFVLGEGSATRIFDVGEQSPYADLVPDRRATERRLATLFSLARFHEEPAIILLPAAALTRRVVPASEVLARSHHLVVEDEVDRDVFVRRLTDSGYLRVPLVEDPGTFSVRGALLDVWPPGAPLPCRVELDGDFVASLKIFDPEDQRSREQRSAIWLPPAREAASDEASLDRASASLRARCDAVDYPSSKTRALIEDVLTGRSFFGADGFLPAFTDLAPLTDQLPEGAVVVVEEPSAVVAALQAELERAETDALEKRDQPSYPLEAFYVEREAIDAWLGRVTALGLSDTPILGDEVGVLDELGGVDDDTPSLGTRSQQALALKLGAARAEGGHAQTLAPLVKEVESLVEAGLRVIFTARSTAQAERLATMLQHRDLEARHLEAEEVDPERLLEPPRGRGDVVVAVGPLERGVVAPAEGLAFITEEEVFGSRKKRKQQKRKAGRAGEQLLEDLRSLGVGDHVVHVEHGIGRYEGLIHRNVGGHTVDLLVVSYAGGDRLYLPVYRLNQVHKFRGGEGAPKLDKLGGQTFARTKSRTQKKVREMADKLLALYAQRAAALGETTPAVDDEYRAFEATFPYEETRDQAAAIAEVLKDLEQERVMDRLVCGDVGFGKTEVAMRAAFKAVNAGKQVAVLVPTTVLALQHFSTFTQRLAAFPVRVEMLSRLRSEKDQRVVLAGLADGSVDIVIGTHRLVQRDVSFKDLGLVIVDEEQRFGV